MGRTTIITGTYEDRCDVYNMVRYCLDIKKSRNLICNTNHIITTNPFNDADSIAEQMILIANSSPLPHRKMIYHITYDYDPDLDTGGIALIQSIAESLQEFYGKYQSIYAVHENTRILHTHMVFNNLPITGNVQLSHMMDNSDNELLSSLCETIFMLHEENARLTTKYVSNLALSLMWKYKQFKLTRQEWETYFSPIYGDRAIKLSEEPWNR